MVLLYTVIFLHTFIFRYRVSSDYETPYMPEAVRQELRELYMGRVDTYPYFYYPVRRRGGMRDMDRPLPPDLVDPNPREYLIWKASSSLKWDHRVTNMWNHWIRSQHLAD